VLLELPATGNGRVPSLCATIGNMEPVQLIDRQLLADAVKVAALNWHDQPRAMGAARRAIRVYAVQPLRGSDWFRDNHPEGLTGDQARRLVFEFTSGSVDRCTTRTAPEHREPCALCASGTREVAALRERIITALESGEQVPRDDGTGTAPAPPQRRSQPRQKPPEPPARVCGNSTCGKSIVDKPPLAKYCSNSCRVVACRRRKRK
jgi:hypothetical protein